MADPSPPSTPRPTLADHLLRWRPAINARAAARAALIALPLAIALVAWLATGNAPPATEAAHTRRPAQPVAPALSPTLAEIGSALPAGARLAAIGHDGHLSVVVETTEPDRLRAALITAPGSPHLRTVAEAALPDGGYRVTLEQAR